MARFLFLLLFLSIGLPDEAEGGGNIPFAFVPSQGANCNWTGANGAAWDDAGNWACAHVPTGSEVAYFGADCVNCSPHITAATSVGGVYMDAGFGGTIVQDAGSGKTFAVSGPWTQQGGSFLGGDQTFTVTGVFTMAGGSFTATTGISNFNGWTTQIRGGTFLGTSGPLNLNSFEVSGSVRASSGTTTVKNGLTFHVGATFNHNSGLFLIQRPAGSTAYPADYAGVVFNNLKLQSLGSGGNFYVYDSSFTVAGDLTLDSAAAGALWTNGTIAVAGNVIVTGYGLGGGGLVKVTKPGAVTLNGAGATVANLPSLELSGAGTALTASGSPVVNGTFNCLTAQSNTLNGAISIAGNMTANCALAGNAAITISGATSSTLSVGGGTFPNGLLTVAKTAANLTLASNLNLSAGGQGLTVQSGTLLQSGRSLGVNGALTIQSGATLTRGGGALTYGSLSNSGTLNP
jgi:hypothetical protein